MELGTGPFSLEVRVGVGASLSFGVEVSVIEQVLLLEVGDSAFHADSAVVYLNEVACAGNHESDVMCYEGLRCKK